MKILMYISVILAAAALAVLAVFLLTTLKAAERTLANAADTLQRLDGQAQNITEETTELLEKTNHLADDFKQKSDKLDVLLNSFKGIGTTFDKFSSAIRRLSDQISASASKNQEKASEVLKWGNSIIDFWKKKKTRKE